MVDKNEAVLSYLMNCPAIYSSPLYFNFIHEGDNNKQFITMSSDANIEDPYIDGSVLKRYSFTLVDFKSVSYNQVVKIQGYPNENVEDISEVQDIIDWITDQNDARNFPDFGEDCVIDSIVALDSSPNLDSIDTSLSPALVQYSVTIRIEYLDKSRMIWK